MNPRQIEDKWQQKWEETGLYRFDKEKADDKLYVLEMFSYPSGSKLHVGHWYNYGPTDTYARFKRMQGHNVFHPQGFDAFGLPAENFAIKTGIHPKDSTLQNIQTMLSQLKRMGATYDWSTMVVTCSEDYYKWTQWCFLQLYKNDLAYRKQAPVNWCPSCNTVLANEQVTEGACERCNTTVERKNLTQWFFKITQYAEELLQDLDKLDWPNKTKLMQKNWIGKSVGGEVTFTVEDSGEQFGVFTTRADTLYGCSYVVIAPEHEMVARLTTPAQQQEIADYQAYAAKSTEIDRLATTREKTGAFTGSYAINPINGKRVPMYVADYVLASYGTGIVMAVPAHDERDFEFAQKYNLPIERVIRSADGGTDDLPYCAHGVLVNSDECDGLTTEQGKQAILSKLETQGLGGFKINYRLRDWLISRQRYWGAPIPIIHCPHCGAVPVPEDQLPVTLPYDVAFTPDGTSPLLKSESFINVPCPTCGAPAKREADTMDTFVCSSWYFLRYPNAQDHAQAFDKEWTNKLLPVDTYVGGAEHACMHLLYARFFTKALRDMGLLSFDEPFLRLVHQGTILGPDGNKMSKSKGNVIAPDALIEKYGSDVFRMYLEFGFSYVDGGIWNDDGIKSIARFIDRIWRLTERCISMRSVKNSAPKLEKELNFVRHHSIQMVSQDVEKFQFNTAIARIMELVNAINKYSDNPSADGRFFEDCMRDLLLLLAPFAPHTAEQMWEEMGYGYSIFNQKFPICDPAMLVVEQIEYGVQINGKLRTRVNISAQASAEDVQTLALQSIASHLEDKTVRKVIVVKNVINVVAK